MRLVMCIDGNLAQSALIDQSGSSGTSCSKGVHGGQWTVLQVHTILSTMHDLWAWHVAMVSAHHLGLICQVFDCRCLNTQQIENCLERSLKRGLEVVHLWVTKGYYRLQHGVGTFKAQLMLGLVLAQVHDGLGKA